MLRPYTVLGDKHTFYGTLCTVIADLAEISPHYKYIHPGQQLQLRYYYNKSTFPSHICDSAQEID